MNANEIAVLAKAALDGSIPFPEIVGKLIANGVEYYHVDYATGSFAFYSASGATVVAPLTFERLPSISEDFDVEKKTGTFYISDVGERPKLTS